MLRVLRDASEVGYNLAMRKPQKALPIFLTLLISWILSPHAQKVSEDFEGFEDDVLVLTQLSERITVEQLSLKSFRCQERIMFMQKDQKTLETKHEESIHTFTVSRKPDQRVNEKLIFSESRIPPMQMTDWPQSPLFDQPFTGRWIETFSFENRLANDFKKLPAEQIEGRECVIFAFETVPQISSTKITLVGKAVPLRQRGQIWIDAKSFQLLRLTARQTKLPKGCRSYEYRIEFRPQSLFGRSISMPARIHSKIGLKDKLVEVVQEYSNFDVI
jgi:hypothetical protein